MPSSLRRVHVNPGVEQEDASVLLNSPSDDLQEVGWTRPATGQHRAQAPNDNRAVRLSEDASPTRTSVLQSLLLLLLCLVQWVGNKISNMNDCLSGINEHRDRHSWANHA